MPARSIFEEKYLEVLNSSAYIASVKRPGQRIVGIETYTYDTILTPLNLNVPVTNNIQTHADSDFVFAYLSASINLTANGDMKYNRSVTLQIQDLSTGKFFFNIPTIMTLVCGGGGYPYVFPSPRVIAPNTAVAFTAMNKDTSQNYLNLFVAMTGTRIFY